MTARKSHLVGRTITAVEFRPFNATPDGKGGTAHNPRITLDNGRELFFLTEETEVGEYGTMICITDPVPRGYKE